MVVAGSSHILALQEIISVCNNLRNKNAAGYNGISPKIAKLSIFYCYYLNAADVALHYSITDIVLPPL